MNLNVKIGNRLEIFRIFFIISFSFLTAASAFVKVPMYPVPFTLQTLFVLLAANILGKNAGTVSQKIKLAIFFGITMKMIIMFNVK